MSNMHDDYFERFEAEVQRAVGNLDADQDCQVPSPSVIDEKQSLEIDKLKADFEEIKAANARTKIIHWTRIVGLFLLFSLVVAWLVIICLFVGLSGYQPDGKDRPILHLSDPVVISLIGSTTVNVIGLFYLAAKWLYPNHNGG